MLADILGHGPYGTVDTIVSAHLNLATLCDAACTDKHGCGVCATICVLEQGVDVVGHLFGLAHNPLLLLLVEGDVEAGHAVGVLIITPFAIVAIPAGAVTTYAHHKDFVALAVGYDGRVAEAQAPDALVRVAEAIGNLCLGSPCVAVPVAACCYAMTHHQVYLTVADVIAAGAIVVDGKYIAIGSGSESGDTIGLALSAG